jgi:hypothetical protein
VISTEPAGGPRPLPGTAAGSDDEGALLVSVVAPSDGGGAIAPELVVTGDSDSVGRAPALPPAVVALRLVGSLPVAMVTGALLVLVMVGIGDRVGVEVATSAVASGSTVGGAEAVVTVIGTVVTVVATGAVCTWGVSMTVVVVVGTVVSWTDAPDTAELIGAVDGRLAASVVDVPLLMVGSPAPPEAGVVDVALSSAVRMEVCVVAAAGCGTAGAGAAIVGVAGPEPVTTGALPSAPDRPLAAAEPGPDDVLEVGRVREYEFVTTGMARRTGAGTCRMTVDCRTVRTMCVVLTGAGAWVTGARTRGTRITGAGCSRGTAMKAKWPSGMSTVGSETADDAGRSMPRLIEPTTPTA